MKKDNLKWCGKCEKWKQKSEFANNKNAKDKKQVYCRICSLEQVQASKQVRIENDVAYLIAEKIIRNVRIEKIGARLLLNSCTSRMNDEFYCEWENRRPMCIDLITKIDGFWLQWLRLTDIYDKENDPDEKRSLRPTIDRVIESKLDYFGYRKANVWPLSKSDNTIKAQTLRYDVFNLTDNENIADLNKKEVMEKLGLSHEQMRKYPDSGMIKLNDKIYVIQTKSRSDGKHSLIVENIANEIEPERTERIVIQIPVKMPNGEIAQLEMPFRIDPRFMQIKRTKL
jgi:hypothetical protein